MKPQLKLSICLLCMLAIAGIFLGAIHSRTRRQTNPIASLPSTVLWAWERPEDLRFIERDKFGVAYLAKTISLSGSKVFSRPRLQPLQLAPDTSVVAVVRIESNRSAPPELTERQLTQTVDAIVEVSQSRPTAIQIDFDAGKSEREFYRELLRRVSRQISPTPLSITALASWCSGDRWLAELPVAEVVPMQFRMGVERSGFASRLANGETRFPDPCDRAAGVSTDELISAPEVERLYIFSPSPWTPLSLQQAMEDYKR